MKFTIIALPPAQRDVRGAKDYIAARSKAGAKAWVRAFNKAVSHLEKSADSCPLAAENELVDFEIREYLFKTRRGLTSRILFTISEKSVVILRVRRSGQDNLDASEIHV